MYRDRPVAVVIPAHDEARFIAKVILTMPGFVDHVVVVDDGSRDATSEAAASVGDPRLVVRRRAPRTSASAARWCLATGRALELDAELIVKMDADGQMPPEYLSELLDALLDGDAHYAKGNRFLHPASLSAMPTPRRLGNDRPLSGRRCSPCCR